MKAEYEKILKAVPELYKASAELDEIYKDTDEEIALSVSAPVIYLFARYIIEAARADGIKKLFFFARDGYSVKRAADAYIRKTGIDMETCYFCCSRYSLRMAAYRFRDSTAYDRLFLPSYSVSAYSVLSRAGFDDAERAAVCSEIGFDISAERASMSRSEFDAFCSQLKASESFASILMKKSAAAYENMLGYIRENKMDSCDNIGVADLGWTGSMQDTLKAILASAGINSPITGYYLGLLEPPPQREGSIFRPMLFDGKGGIGIKSWFAHNIMECICTAPHGMTVGYSFGGRYEPVMKECENDTEKIAHLSDIIAEFAEKAEPFGYDRRRENILAAGLLKALMYTPSVDEAEVFGKYSFCDDVSESYHRAPAVKAEISSFRNELFTARIAERVTGRRSSAERLLWFCGSLAVSDVSFKPLLRAGYRLTQLIRYILLDFRK